MSPKAPPFFISKLPVYSIQAPVEGFKLQQNQMYRKDFKADQVPTEHTKGIYSNPTLPTSPNHPFKAAWHTLPGTRWFNPEKGNLHKFSILGSGNFSKRNSTTTSIYPFKAA